MSKYKEGDLVKIKPIIFKVDKELNENQFDAKQYDEEGNLIDVWTFYRDTELYRPAKTLEQYTGFKDIKGQKIYEGDILKTSSNNGVDLYNRILYKVYRSIDGAFRVAKKIIGNGIDEGWKKTSQTVHAITDKETQEYYSVEVMKEGVRSYG